jgi:hypothetical protein
MEAMTRSWTDGRLEERFDRIDQRFDDAAQRFDRIDADFRELRGEMNGRFDATQHLIIRDRRRHAGHPDRRLRRRDRHSRDAALSHPTPAILFEVKADRI